LVFHELIAPSACPRSKFAVDRLEAILFEGLAASRIAEGDRFAAARSRRP
jgi:hypothetical protein